MAGDPFLFCAETGATPESEILDAYYNRRHQWIIVSDDIGNSHKELIF